MKHRAHPRIRSKREPLGGAHRANVPTVEPRHLLMPGPGDPERRAERAGVCSGAHCAGRRRVHPHRDGAIPVHTLIGVVREVSR